MFNYNKDNYIDGSYNLSAILKLIYTLRKKGKKLNIVSLRLSFGRYIDGLADSVTNDAHASMGQKSVSCCDSGWPDSYQQ